MGNVAADGSLLGKTGKWGACGWAVVQLDYDEEMGAIVWDVWFDGGRTWDSAHHQEGRANGISMPSQFRQYCHVGNTAQHCRLGLFQDLDFAGDLEVENLSPSVGRARSKLLSRTVPQSLKSFLWMLDHAWMGYLLSISGTCSLRCYVQPTTLSNQTMIASGKPAQDRTQKPKHQLKEESKKLINSQL